MQPKQFDPRQQMIQAPFELQYKRDRSLKSVELHHHDFYEISYLISGDVTCTVESRFYRALPGDLLLVSPKELHQIHIEADSEAYERYVLWIDPRTIRQLSEPWDDLGKYLDPLATGYGNQLRPDPAQQKQLLFLLKSLYQEQQEGGQGTQAMQKSLLTLLLVQIGRLASSEISFHEAVIRTSKPVSEAVAYIQRHYAEDVTLKSMADRFGVSKYYLSHEFQRLMGISVCRYLKKKRLLIARGQLFEGEKPGVVAISCGFGDYTGFYRAFKEEYGISPREYTALCEKRRAE